MSLDSELALRRAYFLGTSQNGQDRKVRVTSSQELAVLLRLENNSPQPQVLVLPGRIDKPTWETLLSHGGPDGLFCDEHAYGTPSRGYRHQVRLACRWRFPQILPDGCKSNNARYGSILGNVVLLSASLWAKTVPMLLVERPAFTEVQEPFKFMTLEEEIGRVIAPRTTLEGYVNLLVYERWESFVAMLRPCDMSQEMLFAVTKALEQNLDQARSLLWQGGQLYFADVDAWREMLRKLKRRLAIMASGIRSIEEPRANERGRSTGANKRIRPNEEPRASEEPRSIEEPRASEEVGTSEEVSAGEEMKSGEEVRASEEIKSDEEMRSDDEAGYVGEAASAA